MLEKREIEKLYKACQTFIDERLGQLLMTDARARSAAELTAFENNFLSNVDGGVPLDTGVFRLFLRWFSVNYGGVSKEYLDGIESRLGANETAIADEVADKDAKITDLRNELGALLTQILEIQSKLTVYATKGYVDEAVSDLEAKLTNLQGEVGQCIDDIAALEECCEQVKQNYYTKAEVDELLANIEDITNKGLQWADGSDTATLTLKSGHYAEVGIKDNAVGSLSFTLN